MYGQQFYGGAELVGEPEPDNVTALPVPHREATASVVTDPSRTGSADRASYAETDVVRV